MITKAAYATLLTLFRGINYDMGINKTVYYIRHTIILTWYLLPVFINHNLYARNTGLNTTSTETTKSVTAFQYTVYSYPIHTYGGGKQNWDICTDSSGKVYIANNAGLLTVNGSDVKLYELAAKTIIRSVLYYDKKIYTGSFEEFGYWEYQNDVLKYHSLTGNLPQGALHNDEIWKIIEHNQKIYFQSFGNIFCLDKQTGNINQIILPGPVLFLLKADQRLFVQKIEGSLYEMINEELTELKGSDIFSGTEIKSIIPTGNNQFVIGTSSEGLFLFDNKTFKQWNTEITVELEKYKLNNGLKLGHQMAFGTIMKGVYIIDFNGKLLHHLHNGNSIQNNTILAMAGDSENNLWIAMDQGFDYVWLNSPAFKYIDAEIGTVYTACMKDKNLYVGTNRGIYVYTPGSNDKFLEKKFIEESQGQVWMLKIIDGLIYAGLNNGTYIIEKDNLKQVSNKNGGYNMIKLTSGDTDYYLQSTYNQIVVYGKNNLCWKEKYSMDSFMAPCRFLESENTGNLILGHAIKGIFKIQPSPHFEKALHVEKLGAEHQIDENINRIFKVDNRIIIPMNQILYQWDALANRAVPYEKLNKQLGTFAASRTIISDNNNHYWFVNKYETGLFEIRFENAKLLYRILPDMFGIQLVDNYENIVKLNDSLHLFCLDNGFLILNMYKLNQIVEVYNPPEFNDIIFSRKDDKKIRIKQTGKLKNEIPSQFNNFYITFSSSDHSGRKKYYQYQLENIDTTWCEWTSICEARYLRLPPGNYNFKVRSLTPKGIHTSSSNFRFRILQPWYLTGIAFFVYFFFVLLTFYLFRISLKRKKWKQQEMQLKRENEQIKIQKENAEKELIKLTNEKLQTELSLKNMQLAKNAIAISRKNELLNEIKNEFETLKKELGYRLPNKYADNIDKLIHKNLSDEKEWELFAHHFDQAHQHFFKRLKDKYPELTPNDLRLCAYLKLNLSSKEIASLLNITIRGVEEKRYRLRKKLNLNSEQGLADFILHF